MTSRIICLMLALFSSSYCQQQDIKHYVDSDNSAYVWYEFRPLGIKFRSFSDFHQPFDLTDTRTLDVSDWKTFSVPRWGVAFNYPPSLTPKVIPYSSDYPGACDSVIQFVVPLVKHYSEDSSETSDTPVVEIFFTTSTLDDVAKNEGFEYGPLQSPFAEEDTIAIRDTANFRWIVLGRQGMQEEASYLDGPVWTGVRGENLTGIYHREGGYIMSVPFVTAFLMRPIRDDISIVAKFYEGPTLDVEDEVQNTISEEHFYYIVSSLVVLRR